MFEVVLEKAEEPEINLSTSAGSSKKQENSRNIYFCFIDYAKAFVWITINWKTLREMAIWDHLTYMQVRKQQLELNMDQHTDSK